MSDKEKKNIEVNNAAVSSDSIERLRAAGRRLSPSRSGLSASHISKDERAARALEAKAKLRENIERAGRAAAESRELADSKNEYRRDVLARESKNAEAAKRERERLEADARIERARKIEEERTLYLQREREANARASESVMSLFERLSAREADAPSVSTETLAEADSMSSAEKSASCSAPMGAEAESIPEAPSLLPESEESFESVIEASCDGAEDVETLSESLDSIGVKGADGFSDEIVEAVASADAVDAPVSDETVETVVSADAVDTSVSDETVETAASAETVDAPTSDEAMPSSSGSDDERITLDIGGSSEPSSKAGTPEAEKITIRISDTAAEARSRDSVSIEGDTIKINPSATHPHYPYKYPRVDFSGELHEAEARHLARRRDAVSIAAGIYSEELRLLAEEEARYAAEIAEIKARRSEYSEWLSELDGKELIYGEHTASAAHRRPRVDPYSELGTREFEKHNESTLEGKRIGEDDMLREYDRYVADMERTEKDGAARKSVGEALPYAREAELGVPSATEPGYEEVDYDSLSDAYRHHSEPYADELGGYVPMGYGIDSDRDAVREYEAEMYRRKNAELRSNERTEKKREDMAELDLERIEEAEKHSHFYRGDGLDLYAKNRLSARLDRFYKESAVLLKNEKRLAKAQKKATPEDNIQIIVKKIAIAKELCEMAADALGACVYVDSKARTGRQRRVLLNYIEKYNSLCDEYERHTGRAVDRLDTSMVDDVMAGKLYQPIQNVYYHGMEDDPTHAGLTPALEREHRLETEDELLHEEYARYVSEGAFPEQSAGEKRAEAKRRSERMGAIRRAAERDLLLISLRAEHRIHSLQARKDVLSYSFDIDKKDRQREIRKIEKQIGKIRYAERRSHELERGDNSRYYYLAALPLSEENVKRGARRERLEALRLRLDVLLAERESINERLIALYGGSDGRYKKARVARKAGKIRKRAAKATYKRQRELARKIDKIRAPIDMKERAIELLNKKIADASEYEALRYTLRTLHPGGRAREELLRSIRRAKKRLRSHDREIRYMLKKLKRHEEKYKSDREWAIFLIVLAVIIGVGVAAWMLFGDSIKGYFSELAAYFGF